MTPRQWMIGIQFPTDAASYPRKTWSSDWIKPIII